jgi:hypothetical protein
MRAHATVIEPIDKHETLASTAFSHADGIAFRDATAKEEKLLELDFGLREARPVRLVGFTHSLAIIERDDRG